MQIIQFNCNNPDVAKLLQAKILTLVNCASMLNLWANTPDYVSNPFDFSVFSNHLNDPTLYWANYDSIYNNITDNGRIIADILLSPGQLTGLLNGATLYKPMPETILNIVEVTDLVASGYLVNSNEEPNHV